jgi:hypothetical protein
VRCQLRDRHTHSIEFDAMRYLRTFLLAAVVFFVAFSPLRASDDDRDSLRIDYGDKGAVEKTEHSPVMQYALAGLMVLSVLVVVCMPSRKPF